MQTMHYKVKDDKGHKSWDNSEKLLKNQLEGNKFHKESLAVKFTKQLTTRCTQENLRCNNLEQK